MALTLFIGNKNYSSWSMRPWVLLRQAGIEFREVKLRFDSFDAGSAFKRRITELNPAGRVPVLEDDGFAIWDSLAIAEYLAEKFPEKRLWPKDMQARARARSICAEMHSGFGALRAACPMNIEADLAVAGKLIWRDKPAVREDVSRISRMWLELLAGHKGPFLFGDFCITDAFFAPVCMRLKTYGLPVPAEVSAYMQRVGASPGVKAWIEDALAEHDFRDFEEPYRIHAGRASI
jgi:glutathione S-transferase